MTKEEIRKILQLSLEYYKLEIFGTGKESEPPTEARIDWIYEKMKLSSPSNLDEAAKEEANDLLAYMKIDGDMIYLPTAKALMIALARFGAEWMAGQGVTVKGLLYGGNLGIPDIPEEFYTDKEEAVIVQIRKK